MRRSQRLVFVLGLLWISVVFLAGCMSNESNQTKQIAIPLGNLKTFLPVESEEVLNNPYMGWAPWATNTNSKQPHRLAFINDTWKQLEPQKGKIDFANFEQRNNFAYWRSRGVKLILRINMDIPGAQAHRDLPDWLHNETKDGIDYNISYGKGYSPNYNNAKLIQYHEVLVKKLAERYNDDSLIAYIQFGTLGHWGELHTYLGNDLDLPFPKINVLEQYLAHYLKYFSKKCLMVRRPLKMALDHKLGYFNDSLGDEEQVYRWGGLEWLNNGYTYDHPVEKHPGMPNWWTYAPTGGEFVPAPCVPVNFENNQKFKEVLKMVKDLHVSWVGPCCPAGEEVNATGQKNVDQMQKTIGYRFVLQKVVYPEKIKAGGQLQVEMSWFNKGTAPFYYSWPLYFGLIDTSGKIVTQTKTAEDIRTWLPGTKVTKNIFVISSSLVKGTYSLAVAIFDPEKQKPGIELAINGRQKDGWYKLGTLTVE